MNENIATPPFPLAGEIASLGAAMIWACSLTLFTYFGKGIPAHTLNLFKNIIAVICLTGSIMIFQPQLPPDSYYWWTLGLSGVIGLSIGDTALFGALKRLGAQFTSVSQCIVPPMAAMVAFLWMGESLSFWETSGMLCATSAVAFILFFSRKDGTLVSKLRPGVLWSGLLMALIAAFSQTAAVVLIRENMQNVDVLIGTLARTAPAMCILFLPAIINKKSSSKLKILLKDRKKLIGLTTAAFFGTFIGLLLMSTGAKYTKAGVTTALTATYPVWIIPLSAIFLKEKITFIKIFFTIMAVGGIGIMVYGN